MADFIASSIIYLKKGDNSIGYPAMVALNCEVKDGWIAISDL